MDVSYTKVNYFLVKRQLLHWWLGSLSTSNLCALKHRGRVPKNISRPFHIYFKPQLPTQFSRHILCSVFVQPFDIAVVFQNQSFALFFLPCHVLIIYT